MSIDQDLEKIALQEKHLQFKQFDSGVAWDIGTRLKAAAEYLSLSPWKVRGLIQAGRLPVVQDAEGSPFLLDVRDLDGYVERNKRLTPL